MKKIWSLVLTLLVLCMAGSALADGTHTVVDHGGNEVEVPDKITRVVIDQIPILSTYMSYFGGEAPYIVGFCGSFKTTISETVLKNIAPELMETADTVYAQSDLNIEEIMKLEPDVILYQQRLPCRNSQGQRHSVRRLCNRRRFHRSRPD